MSGRSRGDGLSSTKAVSGNASDIVQGSSDDIDPPYPASAGPLPNAASANTATQNHNIPGTGSGSPYVDAIIWGNAGWNLSSGPITYWFGSPDDPNRPSETPLDGWSAAERQAFVGALANYAAVSNLRFEEATSEANANIVAFQVTSTTYLGLAEVPDGSVSHGGNPNQVWVRYAFNATSSWSQTQPGGDGYQTILHELGHTLGLAHPQDGGSQPDATVFPGLHDGDTGLYEQNQGPYTAMTYNLDYDEAPQENSAYGENASLGAFDIAAIQRLYGVNTTYRTGNDSYALPTVNAVGTYWSTIWDAGGSDEISAAGASGPAVIDLRPAPLNGPYAGGFISQVAGIRGGLTIASGVTIENATGGSGGDRLIGNDAANGLVGGDGADTLVGGAGSDQLTGGDGADLLYGDALAALPSGVSRTGSGAFGDTGDANTTVATAFNLNALFGLGANSDIADANAVPHVTVSASGGTGTDYYSVTIANPGATITLDVDHPSIGFDAQMRLISPAGNVVAENDDNDVYFGAGGSTVVGGTLSRDPFLVYNAVSAGVYTIAVTRFQRAALQNGDSYQLQVSVADAPSIGDGVGDDLIAGGAGNDTAFGGFGNDTVFGNQGADVLFGNQGNDTLFGGQDQDTLFGGQNEDIVLGNLGDDVVLGNLGNDTLYGGQGNDTLYGGQNDDVLYGDLGDDVLSGDLGADRYVFGQNSGADLVVGFSQAQGDRLDLSGQTYSFGTAADGSGSALLVLSGGGTIELAGITQAQVNAGFFA